MKKPESFEKSMETLEEIVTDMEEGKLSLDAMIERFEDGQKLIKFCTGKLDEVERKIEKLLNSDGDTEPFGDEESVKEEDADTEVEEPAKEHSVDDAQGALPF